MDGTGGLKYLPKSTDRAYEALGNAINVRVAKLVAEALLGEALHQSRATNIEQILVSTD
ncbi:hypothetical protein MUP38_04000 [Candidatus Bathyarchaeota archaeon]|nr:hypothetical protein [Candidatus Bathyarchaeota archaeon]